MERKSFLIVDKAALANKRVSATAKLLFAQLCDHRNKKTGQCNPKQATLARELGVSMDTIQRAIVQLRDSGFLTIKRTQYGCNYLLQIPQNAVSQTAKCGFPKPQNRGAGAPYPLYELDINEPKGVRAQKPRAPAASFSNKNPPNAPLPPRKSAQSEVLEAYYREERRKAGR